MIRGFAVRRGVMYIQAFNVSRALTELFTLAAL